MGTCFLLSGLLGPIWHVFSIILVDLEREFGGSRLDTSLAFSIFALSHALSTPFLGRALVSFDSKRLMVALSLLLGLGLYLAANATSLLQFYIAFGLVAGIGTQAFGSYFVFSLIANRIRSNTGTSMALADAGAGVGIFVGLPILHVIQEADGWRGAFLTLALVAALCGPLAHLFLLPKLRIPKRNSTENAAPKSRTALISGLLVLSMLLGTIVLQALQTHQVAAFQYFGAASSDAVWTVSIAGVTVFLSRLATGLTIDRWGAGRTMAVAFLGAALSFLSLSMFAASQTGGWLLVYPLAFAIGFGSQGIIYAAQQRQLLTPREFIHSLSLTRLSAGLGLFAGPMVGAATYEFFDGYNGMLVTLALIALAHFCIFFASLLPGRVASPGKRLPSDIR